MTVNVRTSDKYDYLQNSPVWRNPAPGEDRPLALFVSLEVSAKADIHIWVGDEGTRRGYEILIGGSHGTFSEVRRGKQGLPLVTHYHSAAAMRGGIFWLKLLRMAGQVVVAVGRGEDNSANRFMVAKDTKGRQLRGMECVYVSTGFGYAAQWKVGVQHQLPEDEVEPDSSQRVKRERMSVSIKEKPTDAVKSKEAAPKSPSKRGSIRRQSAVVDSSPILFKPTSPVKTPVRLISTKEPNGFLKRRLDVTPTVPHQPVTALPHQLFLKRRRDVTPTVPHQPVTATK